MNKISRAFFIFIILICGCEKKEILDSSYQEVMSAINSYEDKLKEKNDIELKMYGLHYAGPDKVFDNKIHTITLGYRIDKKIKYEEARRLFYEVANGLIEKINKNDSFKEYFYHFPIGYEDLDLILSFDYEKKGFLEKDDIAAVRIMENQIFYRVVEEKGPVVMNTEQFGPNIQILKEYNSKIRFIHRSVQEDLALNGELIKD